MYTAGVSQNARNEWHSAVDTCTAQSSRQEHGVMPCTLVRRSVQKRSNYIDKQSAYLRSKRTVHMMKPGSTKTSVDQRKICPWRRYGTKQQLQMHGDNTSWKFDSDFEDIDFSSPQSAIVGSSHKCCKRHVHTYKHGGSASRLPPKKQTNKQNTHKTLTKTNPN